MEKWFTYIIKCADGSFYVGHTSDIGRRFHEHASGHGGRYTKLHKALGVVYAEEFLLEKAAMDRERQIKGWTRQKKENLILRHDLGQAKFKK